MSKYLFDGLPPKVATYIKIHLRQIYSTRLFSYQEREDLIQDLVLFYLERFHKKRDVPDELLFISIKTKTQQIIRTRLRRLRSGFLNTESLNSMSEDEGFEPESDFSLQDLEDKISFIETRKLLTEKQNRYIDLIFAGETVRNARKLSGVAHTVMKDIEDNILRGKKKIQKK